MALTKIEDINLQYLNIWFSNIVDAINFDLTKIQEEVPTLNMVLTTIDAAPIEYLKDSLVDLVKSVNEAFDQIDERLSRLEEGR